LYYGQSIPKTLASVSADITWKRLRLVAVAELQGGLKIIDGNIWASHVFFNSTLASLQGTDPILEAIKLYSFETGLQSGIIDGSFSKLRNVSLTYDLPGNITRLLGAGRGSFTVTGLNLVTLWRGQTGTFGARTIDPEVRPNTGAYARSYNLAAYNQESWPQSTRVLATVRLSF
jgi:hypothetical protein